MPSMGRFSVHTRGSRAHHGPGTQRTANAARFDKLESALANCPSRRELFASGQIADELRRRLKGFGLPDRYVLSLDVFDTLLLRDQTSELSRFYRFGARMAELANKTVERARISQLDAFLARHLGTKASYRAGTVIEGHREGSIKEIHRVASSLLVGDARLSDAFVAAELAFEAETLTLNPVLVEFMGEHHANGGRVVLVSDMYMHAEHIAELLDRAGLDRGLYNVIVSSADEKLSKSSGALFPLVEKRIGAVPGTIAHIGDSLVGDYQNAKRAGWQAIHLPLSRTDIRQRLADHIKTATFLARSHGIRIDIAPPSGLPGHSLQ